MVPYIMPLFMMHIWMKSYAKILILTFEPRIHY
jgi:hypothetical protein